MKRRERRERKGETVEIRRQTDGLCSGTVTEAGLRADEDGGKMSDGVRGETEENAMDWEWKNGLRSLWRII